MSPYYGTIEFEPNAPAHAHVWLPSEPPTFGRYASDKQYRRCRCGKWEPLVLTTPGGSKLELSEWVEDKTSTIRFTRQPALATSDATNSQLTNLGIALAQAAALCLAFDMGDAYGNWVCYGRYMETPAWKPGCGRSAL